MSPALAKMWVSLSGIGLTALSLVFIYLSRYKLKGIFKIITGIIAYGLMIVAGFIILVVVFSGPTPE